MAMSRLIQVVHLLALIALIAGCGGGGTISGDRIPIHGIPGGGGGDKFDELSPPVTKPPAEVFKDYSTIHDPPAVRWLKNCYATLPPLSSANSVYQNASIQTWADLLLAEVEQLKDHSVTARELERIKKLKEAGLTVLLAEQNVKFTLTLSDYGYIIDNGRICYQGSVQELIDNDEVRRICGI